MNLRSSIAVIIAVFFVHITADAQHDKNRTRIVNKYPSRENRILSDTLKPASFNTGTPVLYKFFEGGYSFGVNKMSDRAFAQTYKVTSSYIVDGIAFWAGAKQQIGDADTLNVIFYQLGGPGSDTSGPAIDAPDTAYRISQITVDQVDTGSLTLVLFNDSVLVLTDYAVGVDLSNINDDTLGIVTTTDGDALGTQLSWNKWSDGTWHTILESINWGMDLDLGIFVIVDNTSANIDDHYFVDGIKLSCDPNPATVHSKIQYEIQDKAKVTLEIFDVNGRMVDVYHEGEQAAGKHTIRVDLNKLHSGIYYYSLQAGSHRLTKKLVFSE
jgi:hypothetical protein